MIEYLVYITFIMYSININIFIWLISDFNAGRDNMFFRTLERHKIPIDRFMLSFRGVLYKSSYLFILLGVILLIRH